MKEKIDQPRSWKRYEFSDAEMKQLLGIDWPGQVLNIRSDYTVISQKTWTVTMCQQPDEVPERYLKPRGEREPEPVPVPKRPWWRVVR